MNFAHVKKIYYQCCITKRNFVEIIIIQLNNRKKTVIIRKLSIGDVMKLITSYI